ncbi:Kelch repeat and BTB domain-containing protein 3 [Orchesella cincta]|uniref:Kelch repeat and BTB domain-containing protein 3 n=1 Tax=Orchesella cincta TaxID=48709 RepID=A0A1D2MJC0_ORCCI|nr:Kelch repeat and BTB domain-containing protein 3 [Orchesella cincta]
MTHKKQANFGAGGGLNEKIFHGKRNSDFVLISENDVEFPCHKGFLNVHSSFFERMFETDCKETQSGKAKLNLSEEGLKAFLDFVYCFKSDFPKEHPRIAVELLEFAHEKQISGLEEAMKELIVGQPHDWMDLIDGVQLFLLSVKLDFEQGYDDVKKAAVKAIKAKRDQLKDSGSLQGAFDV